jgi:hypothetical protein
VRDWGGKRHLIGNACGQDTSTIAPIIVTSRILSYGHLIPDLVSTNWCIKIQLCHRQQRVPFADIPIYRYVYWMYHFYGAQYRMQYFIALMMEAVSTSETSVNLYKAQFPYNNHLILGVARN